jgi:hypothetical protein
MGNGILGRKSSGLWAEVKQFKNQKNLSINFQPFYNNLHNEKAIIQSNNRALHYSKHIRIYCLRFYGKA